MNKDTHIEILKTLIQAFKSSIYTNIEYSLDDTGGATQKSINEIYESMLYTDDYDITIKLISYKRNNLYKVLMILGPCKKCRRENSLVKTDDNNYPICKPCYDKYYSEKVKREKRIDELLCEKAWYEFWK